MIRLVWTGIALLLVLSAAGATEAEARIFGVGGFVGYSRARDADDGTYHVGGDLSLRPLEFLGARLEIGYREDEFDVGGEGFQEAEVESIPILLSAQIFPFGERLKPFSPFLIGGGGWFVTRTREEFRSGEGTVRFTRTRAEQAWHIGGGLDWNVGDHLTLTGDLRWVFLDVDFREVPEADADGIWATAGLKFFL